MTGLLEAAAVALTLIFGPVAAAIAVGTAGAALIRHFTGRES